MKRIPGWVTMVVVSMSMTLAGGAVADDGARRLAFRSLYDAEVTDEDLASMGRYEGTRTGTNETAYVWTKKLTFTRPGFIELLTHVPSASQKEIRRVSIVPGFFTDVWLTLEEYALLFSGTDDVVGMELPAREPVGYTFKASAKNNGPLRTVVFEIELLEDNGKTYVDGALVLVMRDGRFQSFSVLKRSRYGSLFLRKVLDAKVPSLTRKAHGLCLRDDYTVGYVTHVEDMRRAISDPKPETFSDIVGR